MKFARFITFFFAIVAIFCVLSKISYAIDACNFHSGTPEIEVWKDTGYGSCYTAFCGPMDAGVAWGWKAKGDSTDDCNYDMYPRISSFQIAYMTPKDYVSIKTDNNGVKWWTYKGTSYSSYDCSNIDDGSGDCPYNENDHISEIVIGSYPPDTSQAVCNAYGYNWTSAGKCCKPGDDYLYDGNTKICLNETLYSCVATVSGITAEPAGYSLAINSTTSSICTSSGIWNACSSANAIMLPSGVSDSNVCCGDNPTQDLGYIPNGDNWICNSVGGTWSYTVASSIPFQITRVDDLYDAISNGANWYECNPGGIFNLQSGISFTATMLNETPPPQSLINIPSTILGSNNLGQSIFEQGSTLLPGSGNSIQIVDPSTIGNILSTVPIVVPQSNFSVNLPDAAATFTFIPNQIAPYQKLNINITGYGFFVQNTTGNGILILNSSGQWQPTQYGPINLLGYDVNSEHDISVGVTLPPLNSGTYSVNITITTANNQNYSYIFQNAFSIIGNSVFTSVIVNSSNAFNINSDRFLCSEQGNQNSSESNQFGSIVECCGPDYNFCINRDINGNIIYNVTRNSGGPVSLIKDYYYTSPSGADLVGALLFGDNADVTELPGQIYTYYLPNQNDGIQGDGDPLPISDLSLYSYLEFDMYFDGSNSINILLNDTSGNTFLDVLVAEYSTTGNSLNVWHHIKIPITASMKQHKLKSILFYSIRSDLESTSNSYIAINTQGQYYAVFGLSRIFLSSSSDMFCASDYSQFTHDSYNSGYTNVGRWVSDLNKDEDGCNNVPSYHWTSDPSVEAPTDGYQTHCCGFDQSVNISGGETTESTNPNGYENYTILINTTSSGNLTIPVGVTEIQIEMWGAGAGGGGGIYGYPEGMGCGVGTDFASGGGGGSGSQVEETNISVFSGDTYNYIVGAGGSSGSGNNKENNGASGSQSYNAGNGNVGGKTTISGSSIAENSLIASGGSPGIGASLTYSQTAAEYDCSASAGTGGVGGSVTNSLNTASLISQSGVSGGSGNSGTNTGTANGGSGGSAIDGIGNGGSGGSVSASMSSVTVNNGNVGSNGRIIIWGKEGTMSSSSSVSSTPAVDQTYYDTNGACWSGQYVANDTVVPVSVK